LSHDVVAVDFVRKEPLGQSDRRASVEARDKPSQATPVEDLGLYEGALRAIVLAERRYLFACLGLELETAQAHELELFFRASINGSVLVEHAAQVVTAIRKYYGFTVERMNEHIAGIAEFGMRLEFEVPGLQTRSLQPRVKPEPDASRCDVIHWRHALR
jgi:hypothetical protein